MSKLELIVENPTIWASQYDRVPLVCPHGIPGGTTLGLICVAVINHGDADDETKAYYVTDKETMAELASNSEIQKLWFTVPKKLIRPVCPDFE